MSDPKAPVFEIGLVLAGAVSAGCYSAGVMDFLIEALDEYEAARCAPGWDGPTHEVRVPVIAGASAGGMTAGMAALHMFRPLAHIRPGEPVPPAAQNRLYSSWVTEIGIEPLLATTDLDGCTQGLASALCGTVLDKILADAFLIEGGVVKRDWLGRDESHGLRVMMTMTNLRGIPYSFELIGSASYAAFSMLNHADVAAFTLGSGPAPAGQTWLDVSNYAAPAWTLFRTAALATGAFPLGLPPRIVERPGADFGTVSTVGFVDPTGAYKIISPDKRFDLTQPFKYWAVDGGTIDNEPLEQARRYLTGGAPDETDGAVAAKAVILIAPFPNYGPLEKDTTDGTLITMLPSLAAALVSQARFKPDELAKAQDTSDFSRFLISPERVMLNGDVPRYPIASGALAGFSGFLHESFRRHDYLLGRRNAQAFLRWNFSLPADHKCFAGRRIADSWIVRETGDQTGTIAVGGDASLPHKKLSLEKGGGPTQPGYPIIPLTARMQAPIEIPPEDQPRPAAAMLDPLRPLLRRRIKRAVAVLVGVDLLKPSQDFIWPLGGIVRWAARIYGGKVIDHKVTRTIAKALEELAAAFP